MCIDTVELHNFHYPDPNYINYSYEQVTCLVTKIKKGVIKGLTKKTIYSQFHC